MVAFAGRMYETISAVAQNTFQAFRFSSSPAQHVILENSKAKPANLNNTLNREILSDVSCCAICRKGRMDHIAAAVSHEFKRDDNLPRWRGWRIQTRFGIHALQSSSR
jgi:hypothetical protein